MQDIAEGRQAGTHIVSACSIRTLVTLVEIDSLPRVSELSTLLSASVGARPLGCWQYMLSLVGLACISPD